MEDMLEQANEIQEVMSRSYGLPDGLDEDSLDAGARRGGAARAGRGESAGEGWAGEQARAEDRSGRGVDGGTGAGSSAG